MFGHNNVLIGNRWCGERCCALRFVDGAMVMMGFVVVVWEVGSVPVAVQPVSECGPEAQEERLACNTIPDMFCTGHGHVVNSVTNCMYAIY